MKKSNTERIDSVIQQFMRINGIETPYNQYRLIQAWPEVMGDYIAHQEPDSARSHHFTRHQTEPSS